MVDVATLGLAVKFDQVDRASGSLDKFSGAADRAEKSAQGMGKGAETAARKAAAANDNAARSADKAAAAYGKWHTVALRMASVLGTIAGTLATAAVFRYADAWSDMQSRVGAAVRDMEAAPELMQRMVDIANASYSPLDQTVEVYSRNVAVLRDLGKGATEAADFTEALNHALVLTATRGERAASVQNALSKAMAVGKLQADGLETVLANGGEVAQALADELGTTVNGLRNMASQGKITGDVIATALITRLDDLRERAGEMPATIGDAFTRLQTNLTAFIGQMDQATGASQRVSEAIMLVADNISVIARVAAVAGVALLTAFSPAILASMASGFVALGTAGVAAISAITAAIAANPIGAIAVALTTAVTAAYLFRDEIKQAIGIDFVAIIEGAINTVVGVFVGAYEAIKASWSLLPAALGDLVYSTANAVISGVESMVNTVTGKIDEYIGKINSAMKSLPFGIGDNINIGTIGEFSFGRVKNPYEGAASAAMDAASGAFSEAMSRDYVGALKEIAFGTKSATEATEGMTAALGAANGALNEIAGKGGGSSGGGGAKAAADAIKQVEDASEGAKKSLGQGFGGILKGLLDGTLSWKDALIQAGQAALKYINQIMQASGGGGLFGGGFFGGLMGSLLGFSKGGAFQSGNIIPFAKGGVVNKPTVFPFAKGIGLMGEAGPEAIMPLRRGTDGRLGVSAPRSAANDQPIRLEIVSRFDADGGFESAVERSSRPVAMQESAKAAGQVARAVPSMALGAMDNSRTRRTRTISPGGGL